MDDADVVAYSTLTEQYLRKFGNFIEAHFCNLVRTVSSGGDVVDVHGGISSLNSSGDFTVQNNDGLPPSSSSEQPVTSHTTSRHIWDHLRHPIRIHWTPTPETATFEELTCIPHPLDGNPDVQKVMLVLVTITNQVRSLRNIGYQTFCNHIVLYGDGFEGDCGERESLAEMEGEGHIALSRLLPLLLELLEFIQDCTEFAGHWISQIAALFKESKPHVVSITNLQLFRVFREFSDLLALLVIMDEILRNQGILQEHWQKYRQMIKSVRADSRSFDTEADNLVRLERDLYQLDRFIMSSNIFKNFLDCVAQQNQRLLGRNVLLAEKFQHFLTTLSSELERDCVNDSDEYRPVSLAAMYVFAATLFSSCFDKKYFHKAVWLHLGKVPAVAVPGANVWIPEVFLMNCIQGNGSKLFEPRQMQGLSTSRQNFLQSKVSSLSKDILHWNVQYSSWACKMQEVLYLKDLSVINMADLSRKCTLIVEGIKLAQTLSHNFKLVLNLHASLGRPIGKHVVVQLCQILEILKALQGTFFEYSVRLSCSTMYILQYVMHTALVHVRNVQKAILSLEMKRVDEAKADALSVLKILEHCLRGTLSQRRFLVAQIALDWALSTNANNRLWRDDDTSTILPACFERLNQLMNLERNVELYCNGSPVFFHRVILPNYFNSLYMNPHESSKLPLIFMIIRDCMRFIRECSPHPEQTEQTFMTEVESYLKTNFVERLCKDVETDLRILSHTHLQFQSGGGEGGGAPPFRQGVKVLEHVIETPPFSWNNRRTIDFKNIVEYYMSKTFYNLASVALHDWQSYATMRVLAADKYKLNVLDDHLPGHSLEQGRDILEIVRNLPQFVTDFTYNLNNQVFLQVNSPNKHLDTVNIRHLANSLRTHGPGMANTTINFTYKFLRGKIHSLSQFLYDEQIKSRLAKDIKLFKQSHQDHFTSTSQNINYASMIFERAMKFKMGIRKLALTPEGLSPLDQFRVLVTHIGNALGFVRLVRSGGAHYLAGGYQFVPDLQDITQFSEMVEGSCQEESDWTSDIKTATAGIDSAIKTLSSSFSDGVDYFKLLVDAFQPALLDARNAHLRNFYGIIPALTLSYVDHIRLSKEKLAKRSKTSFVFTDDGFAMGIAYLLKVLNQGNDFDSLLWFPSVELYHLRERNTAVQAIHDSKKDEKLQQANTLTAKRLWDVLNEFQLVRYNLSSARIFFQSNNNDNESSSLSSQNTNKKGD